MNRYEKFLPLAIKLANKSHHKYRHGTVLFKKHRVIDTGINQERTHPKAARYFGNRKLHSEQHCLLGNTLRETKNAEMLVVRVDGLGRLRSSKPCHACFPLIVAAGIRRVTFSNNEGKLETITL